MFDKRVGTVAGSMASIPVRHIDGLEGSIHSSESSSTVLIAALLGDKQQQAAVAVFAAGAAGIVQIDAWRDNVQPGNKLLPDVKHGLVPPLDG